MKLELERRIDSLLIAEAAREKFAESDLASEGCWGSFNVGGLPGPPSDGVSGTTDALMARDRPESRDFLFVGALEADSVEFAARLSTDELSGKEVTEEADGSGTMPVTCLQKLAMAR